MESQLYSLLNNLLNPKKFPVILSLVLLLSLPVVLEFFFIVYVLQVTYSASIIITAESLSVLVGYAYFFLVVKVRTHQSLGNYRAKKIYSLVGSFPAMLYLLSPGFVSLALGVILLSPIFSVCIGRKIIRTTHIDPNIIYTLLELNNNK
ncbi:MAG: hypothetical protein AAF975_07640 [Spirochaetota bacterium]